MLNPSGLCECGCGEKTARSRKTQRGFAKGDPVRFVNGHQGKPPKGLSLGERLLRHCEIDPATSCWRRRLSGPNIYRYVKVDGRGVGIHVVAHQLWIGPIPEGYVVDHVYDRGCRYRDCFNPAHLEAVTGRENFLRGFRWRERPA